MTWAQVGSLLVGLGILGWAVISFFIKRMDSMKRELFNHLGEIKTGLTAVCTRTNGQEKRIERIERLLNNKRER